MSNGSARSRVVLVVLDGWGYRRGARGQCDRAGVAPRCGTGSGSRSPHPARGQRPGRRPSRGPDGQQRGRPPEPRRRPGRAAGPGPHLSKHPERRVLPAPAAGGALRRAPADRRHAAPGRVSSARAASTPSTGTCWPAWSWACGTGSPPSPSMASSTAATRRRRSAPRWSARCCWTCGASRGAQVDVATLTGRYFGMDRDRRWDRTQAGLRRDGARRRHAGRASGARGAGRLPAGRDRRVHPPAGPSCGTAPRSPRCEDGDGVLFFNYRSDRMRQIVAALAIDGSTGSMSPDRPGVCLRHHDAVRPDLSDPPGVPAVQPGADPRRGAGRPAAAPSSAPRRPRSIPTSPTSSTAATSRRTRERSAV